MRSNDSGKLRSIKLQYDSAVVSDKTTSKKNPKGKNKGEVETNDGA